MEVEKGKEANKNKERMGRRYGEGEERNGKIGGRVKGKEVHVSGKKAWRKGGFEVVKKRERNEEKGE